MSDSPEYSTFDPMKIPCQEISDPAVMAKEPLVSAKMITYNHEPYIAQAIEGVLIQETDFPIELVIGEDCSTDRTREIVMEYQKKYPDLIRVLISEENVGATKNVLRTERACRGKYVAFCDGDDYWHHPKKLQMQVDYLEAHPECGLVHSDYAVVDQHGEPTTESTDTRYKRHRNPSADSFSTMLILGNGVGTCTACARRELLVKVTSEEELLLLDPTTMIGDLPRWLGLAAHSRVHHMDEVLATYRLGSGTTSNPISLEAKWEFQRSSASIRAHFARKYTCAANVKKIVERRYYRHVMRHAWYTGDRKLAERTAAALRALGGLSLSERLWHLSAGSKLLRQAMFPFLWIRALLIRAQKTRRNRMARNQTNVRTVLKTFISTLRDRV